MTDPRRGVAVGSIRCNGRALRHLNGTRLALLPGMTHRQRKIDCAAMLAVLLAPASFGQALQSTTLQDVESIRTIAADHIRQLLQPPATVTLHAEAGILDRRLRLPACTQAPQAFSPSGELRAATRLTIGVRCESPAWSVYVPVTVESELAVLVTTRALPRNAAVTAQDVESRRRRVPGVAAGYLVAMDQLAGRHLRNPVGPGTPLDVELLAPDVLIRRGQRPDQSGDCLPSNRRGRHATFRAFRPESELRNEG